MQASLSRAERHELIRKDLLSKGMPLEGVGKFLSLLREVSEFREATPEQQKEILQKEDLTSGEPDLKAIYAERYDKVMAGIVGAAIRAASRPSGPNKILFQRRVGRAIWAVTASVLKYAKLVGIAVAQRMQWDFVPIVKEGFVPSVEACRSLSKNLEIQFPVAGEQDTQVPLGAQEIPGMQFQVAEELDTSVPNVDWGPAEAYLPFEINFSKANLCGPCDRAVGVPSFYGRFDIGDGLIPPPTSWQDIMALSNLCISLEEADIEEFDAWLENKRAIESGRLVVQPQAAAELDTMESLDSKLNPVGQPQVAVELNTVESSDSNPNLEVQLQVAVEPNTLESLDSNSSSTTVGGLSPPCGMGVLGSWPKRDFGLTPSAYLRKDNSLSDLPLGDLPPISEEDYQLMTDCFDSISKSSTVLKKKRRKRLVADLPLTSGWHTYKTINTNSNPQRFIRGEENYFEFYSDPWPITTREFTNLFISLDALSGGKDEWEYVEKSTWPKHPFSFNINLLFKKRREDNSVLQKPKFIKTEAFEALSYALNSLKKEEEPLTGKWHCYREMKATKHTPRYRRGNENYIFPPKVYERDCDQHREVECRYCFPRCPIEMHQMLRAKWNPILLASDCWLCPIEALVDVAEMEQHERDDQRFRLQCLQKHIDRLPDISGNAVARKLETATPFKESFGGLFKAVSSHIPSPYRLGDVAAFIAAPALAYCHSELERNNETGGATQTVVLPPSSNNVAGPSTSFPGGGRTLGMSDGAGLNVAPYQQDARSRWLNARQKNVESQRDRISRYADMHGLSYEQARSAFNGATEAAPSQAPLLPKLSQAYRRRSLFGGGSSTRAQRTVDVVLQAPSADESTASSIFYFNPVSSQELAQMSSGGNTMLSLDALEISIDPVGMPGDDTDITVVAMWNQDRDPQRALLGSVSTFVGNGLARCVFFPGLKLMHQHCSVPDGRVIKFIVSSTNSTLLDDLPRAQISIGTLRQHLGPGHDRTINQDLVESQVRGYRIGATQQGNAVILAPRGTAVEGTPSASVDLGIGRQLVQSGPLSWELTRTQSSRMSITGTSRARGTSSFGLAHVSKRHDHGKQTEGGAINIEDMTAPRYTHMHSGLEENETVATVVEANPFVVAMTKAFEVNKDAKRGTYIGKIDFLREIKDANRLPFQQWVATGLIDPVIQIKIYTGSNPFVGTTIAGTLDMFRRIDVDKLGGKMPVKAAGILPNFVHPLSGKSIKTYSFDTTRLAGHSLYPHARGFADPLIHFYVFGDNAVPCAANWQLAVDILIRKAPRDATFACIPFVSFPYTPPNFLDLGITIGEGSLSLKSSNIPVNVRLDFASKVDTNTSTSLGMTQALYGLNCGIAGFLHGNITKIGTALVSCSVRLVMWWGSKFPPFEETSSMPHEDMDLDVGSQDFRIQFQTPFSTVGSYDSTARLFIYALGGPLAPTGCTASCDFCLKVQGVETVKPPIPIELMGEEIAWCELQEIDSSVTSISIPNHICDFDIAGVGILLRDNPLSRLFSACGFFSGDIEFSFSWSSAKQITEGGASLTISRNFGAPGKGLSLSTKTYNLNIPGVHRQILKVGDFSGFNIPGGTGHETQYSSLWCQDWSLLETMTISARILPGFKFYGWSCIKPSATPAAFTTVEHSPPSVVTKPREERTRKMRTV